MTGLKNHLAAMRSRAGLTQEELADALPVASTKGTISQYESGKRGFSMVRLYELAAALNCTPGQILDGLQQTSAGTILPTVDELAKMIEVAMGDLPVGVSFEDYPAAVAAGLHVQLEQFLASGALDRSALDGMPAAPAGQSRVPTN